MQEELLRRTKDLGVMIIHLVDELPNKPSGWVIGKQILRSATSVGANCRATRRAKSILDFIHKFKIVQEECDETIYWLEVIEEARLISTLPIAGIKAEANELLCIFVTTLKTLKAKP